MSDAIKTRVSIINFHFAHNYGAVLQALALQDRLESLGCEVQVVDYRPRGHWQNYAPLPNPLLSGLWKFRGSLSSGESLVSAARRGLLRAGGATLQWKDVGGRSARLTDFDSFSDEHLHLTRRYVSIRQLRRDPPVADLYVTGSDQVWNPNNTGGIDPAYFLRFGNDQVMRAAYAVSPCNLDVERHAQQLERLCRGLDEISLREADLAPELEAATGRSMETVPDPVLLMTPELFAPYVVESAGCARPYLLLYAVRVPATLHQLSCLVEELRRRLDLEVVDVSLDPSPWPFQVTRPRDLTPAAFVSYISRARFVASNSFHATAFSLLFEKEFAVVTEPGTSSRITELLESVNLIDRMQGGVDALGTPIDYVDVRQGLAKLRTRGMRFLTRIVEKSTPTSDEHRR